MKLFNKITIIGVGLIGGAIGLAVKKKRLAKKVTGVFRRRSTLGRALKHRAIDAGTMSLKEGVKAADLIILATPVHHIPKIAKDVLRYAKKGAVVTDVGSTKLWLVDKIEKMRPSRPSVSFVGSHPMAGSEHTGVEFARSNLFEDSPCIVTRTNRTDRKALAKVAAFWRSLGARVEVMSPAQHDRSVALISHLPHIVAFGLAGAVPEKELLYAAEGFKDTTRVASSDAELWSDIFLTNSRNISEALEMFEAYYKKIKEAISKGDRVKVVKLLAKAKYKRDRFFYGKGR